MSLLLHKLLVAIGLVKTLSVSYFGKRVHVIISHKREGNVLKIDIWKGEVNIFQVNRTNLHSSTSFKFHFYSSLQHAWKYISKDKFCSFPCAKQLFRVSNLTLEQRCIVVKWDNWEWISFYLEKFGVFWIGAKRNGPWIDLLHCV